MTRIRLVFCGLIACATFATAGSEALAQADIPKSSDLGTGGVSDVDVDWLTVTGVNQPTSLEQTGVQIVYTVDGKEATMLVPVEADTSLWKDADADNGDAGGLILRDNRYSQGLIRLQIDAIPSNARVTKAALHFKVQGVQDKGQPGTFNCFRVLTPWSEDATWHKPMPNASAQWNGLQPGKDFDPTAFATLAVPSLNDKTAGGQFISVPDFADAIQHWRDGGWPNQGFLLTLSGKALQLSLPSREAMRNVKSLTLGGPNDATVLLTPNEPLLAHILLKPDDLLGAQIRVTLAKGSPAQLAAGTLKVYTVPKDAAAPGDRQLIGSFPLKGLPAKGPGNTVDIAGPLQTWLRTGDTTSKVLLACEGVGGAIELANGAGKSGLALKIRSYPKTGLFQITLQPKEGVWTRVVDGHLNYGGQRLRLWGVVGYPDAERLVDMGFNAQRVWEPSSRVGPGKTYSVEGIKRGDMETYAKGDGSQIDLADKHFADLKAHGMFVMFGALAGSLPTDSLVLDDSFVSGGADWPQWKDAVQKKGADNPNHYIFVDDRLQKAKLQYAHNILTHLNQYTGKTYGQEENIALYEVYNENGFLVSALGGGLKKWPPYFKAKLQARWNAWLLQQYGNDAGLTKAWGKVEAGELLGQGTVQPGPDFEDRLKYPEKRGGDFVRFMIELENDFNQKFVAFCRAQAPAGTGVNVVPFSLDTMYRPSLQWTYSSTLGDVFSMGMYFWDLKSQLDKPPSAYVIDSYTPANKPVVLYETNVGRPDPYRAEYPLKLAALASTQDWDGIFWHYWGPVEGEGELAYLTGTLAPPVASHYWTAVHHENDPVMDTSMALASRIFLGQYLPPATTPDQVKVGADALFSYSSFRGIGLTRESFSRGSRLEFTPKDNSGLTENGAPMPAAARLDHAIANGKYVTWDWPNGRLIIDAPDVKAYVGRTNSFFRFSDGITLSNVSTPWVSFAMVSADGRPLAGPQATSRILMGAVYDARNTAFAFNYNVVGGPLEQAKAVTNRGHPPILVDKVEYSVWFPQALDGTLKDYDFALRETRSQPITKSNQVTQQGATPFLGVLDVAARGATATLPVAEATRIDTKESTAAVSGSTAGGASKTLRADDLQFPIPGMDWNMDYPTAEHLMRDSPLVYTTLSPNDASANPTKTLSVTDLQLAAFWNNITDATVTFQNNHMTEVDITLKSPPPIDELVSEFSSLLGEPVEKKIDAQYGTTRIGWRGRGKMPDILVTESQGIMKLLYQAPK